MSIENGFIPVEGIVDWEVFKNLPVIGVVGAPSSGKGTVAQILQKKYGFAHATYSQGIRDHATLLHGCEEPLTRDVMKQMGIQMRSYFREGINTKNAMKRIMYQFSQNPSLRGAVLEGFRWESEAQKIAEMQNSYIIWLESDQELRKQRLIERQRPGDMFDSFAITDKEEADWIEPIRPLAHTVLVNNGSLEDLEMNIAAIVQEQFGLTPLEI